LGGGAFGGAFETEKGSRRDDEELQEQIAKSKQKFIDYEELCKQIGSTPAKVALAWLLHQPAVTAPIIGPRTLNQLTGMLDVIDFKLNDETLKKLDHIWPGPGGAAPEAYAW
jgi:aryl-alcohol dehydrogenase-like predicted oxidoreductase